MSITKRTLKRPSPVTGRKVAHLVRVEGRRDQVTGKRNQFSQQVSSMRETREMGADWNSRIARRLAPTPSKTTVAELNTEWFDINRVEITGLSLCAY